MYITKYYDCTYPLFTELLTERENIILSVDCVRKILFDRDILSPKSHRKSKKIIKKKLKINCKNSNSKKEKLKLQSKIISIENAHPTQPRFLSFVKKFKWMPLNIFGLEIKKLFFML